MIEEIEAALLELRGMREDAADFESYAVSQAQTVDGCTEYVAGL